MHAYQQEFIEFAIREQVLRFGEFTLKSGRSSPYFFNTGLFNSGATLAKLGRFYAHAITATEIHFDMLYGPAYKGIPLVATTAIALATEYGMNVPWCFNRKEVKDHGEGGGLVGAPLQGRVLVIDDVITAGTSIRESAAIIHASGARFAVVAIALDRQERGDGELSAIQEIEQRYGVRVINVVSLGDLIEFLRRDALYHSHLQALDHYRQSCGMADAELPLTPTIAGAEPID